MYRQLDENNAKGNDKHDQLRADIVFEKAKLCELVANMSGVEGVELKYTSRDYVPNQDWMSGFFISDAGDFLYSFPKTVLTDFI